MSDLLLAESVHQLVNGNMARASAALDAASGGDSPVPQADVVVTPGDGIPFTHSIMLIAAGGSSWNAQRPRATAEPRLEAWAAQRLGDPANIIVAGAPDASPITVADSKLCALDLIYSAGDRAAFMQRLQGALLANLPQARRAALPSDSNSFQDLPAAGWPAQWRAIGDIYELAASLRIILVSARPLSALDLVAPNAPTTRAAQPAAIAAQLNARPRRPIYSTYVPQHSTQRYNRCPRILPTHSVSLSRPSLRHCSSRWRTSGSTRQRCRATT